MNKTDIELLEIDTVILAGGLGTRLQPVLKDKPKCLAPINGKPFIDILLDNCIDQGLRRFILCVGYLKEQVIEYLSNRNDCEIFFSEEDEPLGTGGALKNAEPFIKSNPVLVLNGDSFVKYNIKDFLLWYYKNNVNASMLLVNVLDIKSFGLIEITKDCIIEGIMEKNDLSSPGLINAGQYLLSKGIINDIPEKNIYSLEKELFPKLINSKQLKGYIRHEDFIDIGTPSSFHKAGSFKIFSS